MSRPGASRDRRDRERRDRMTASAVTLRGIARKHEQALGEFDRELLEQLAADFEARAHHINRGTQ